MSSTLLAKTLAFALAFLILALAYPEGSTAFVVTPDASSTKTLTRPFLPIILARYAVESNDETDAQEEIESPLKSAKETKVYEFLKELSDSKLSFRIVVVGNGAILESTNVLGPTFKVGESPKTGASIVTFASEDQSFEFHVKPAEIASAGMIQRQRPDGTTMRLMRLLNTEGGSVCSLILADDSSKAQSWYKSMASNYGSEFDF